MRERGNSWQIDINLGKGGRHFHTLVKTHYSYEDALALEAEIRRELGKVKHHKEDINSKVHEYLEWVRLHQAPRTYQKKKRDLFTDILPFFGSLTPERITEGIISAYKNKRKNNPRASWSKGNNKSVNDELYTLKSLCRKMFKHRREFEQLPYKRELPTVLTKDEVHRFLACVEPEYKLVLSLMYYAGLRKSEALNLTWGNVRGDSIILSGKGGKSRCIPLTNAIIAELKCFRTFVSDVNGLIFVSKTGRPLRHLHRIIERARKKAGIEKRVYCHILRHSFGTHIVENTGDIRTLQELMGHAKISTTEMYTHISSEQKKKVLERGLG